MKQKKILFVANIFKHILRFHLPYLKWFRDQGYKVHVAANGIEEIPFCNEQFNIPVSRSPYSIKNIEATKMLKEIILSNNRSSIPSFRIVDNFLPIIVD